MRKIRIITIIALVLSFVLAFSGCSALAEQKANFFEYAVKIEDGIFSPQKVDFGASVEEVLKANNLDETAYEEPYEAPDGRIINRISFDGISEEILEVYYFYEGELFMVQYMCAVDQADHEALCSMLYDMAVEYMPEPFLAGNGYEPLKEGNPLDWQDEEGNRVDISPRSFLVSVSRARDVESIIKG